MRIHFTIDILGDTQLNAHLDLRVFDRTSREAAQIARGARSCRGRRASHNRRRQTIAALPQCGDCGEKKRAS